MGFNHIKCKNFENSFSTKARGPFILSGARPHFAPDLKFKLDHIFLKLEVNPFEKTVIGAASYKIRPVAHGQRFLEMDQVGLKIESVNSNQQELRFEVVGNRLRVFLDENMPMAGETFDLKINYRTRDPLKGLYFTGPEAKFPNKPYQVWSQGEDEDNRYWFPCFDYPNQKATSEMKVLVPQGYLAISNGKLISKTDLKAGTEFHYSMNFPHVNYLISLVVGEFTEWSELHAEQIPVEFFVPKGRDKEGQLSFQMTRKMIEIFEQKLGVPYPYDKYSQVAVQDFSFGGMENISATTQSDLTLHDDKAHLDVSSDPLVAHELAHQWFGNLVTCRDWSHAWLNEGFATFMERVWVEFHPQPEFHTLEQRLDEAKYYSYLDLREYLEEDTSRYRRALVSNTYEVPMDLFDRHLYQKGGLFLGFLRYFLGENEFWKALQLYLTRHRGQNVESHDFLRAIEDSTGRNLRLTFEQWVYGGGHPDFEVSYQWHEEKKLAELCVEQKQTQGKDFIVSAEGVKTHLFHLPVCIEFTFADLSKKTVRVNLSEARGRYFFELGVPPKMVRFDPGADIPKTMKFERPKELLLFQLKNDPHALGRIEAAKELQKIIGDPEVISSLGDVLLNDPFWGVQSEVADILAEIRTEQAKSWLLKAVKISNSKARRAVAKALGHFKGVEVAKVLLPLAQGDSSYLVEAQAAHSWLKTFLSPGEKLTNENEAEIQAGLQFLIKKKSYRDVIVCAVLKGISEIPKIEDSGLKNWVDVVIGFTKNGHSLDIRRSAILALGPLARHGSSELKQSIFLIFQDLFIEKEAVKTEGRIHQAVAEAVVNSGLKNTLSLLEIGLDYSTDFRVRRELKYQLQKILSENLSADGESILQLKKTFDKLEEDHKKLIASVEMLKGAKDHF